MSEFFYTPPETKKELVLTNTHLMVDIETLGTSTLSPIISIGAVLFDPRKQDSFDALMERGFMRRINIKDTVRHGKVDGETLHWWFEQDDKAIKALIGPDAVALKTALVDLRQYAVNRWDKGDDKFFYGHQRYPVSCLVWAKSPDFDCKILEAACASVEEIFPFKFFQYRCVRTLQDLAWPNGPDSHPVFYGTKHDALADAVNQAIVVQAGFKQLGLSTQDVSFSTF